ncbi:MAG: glycosyltransferase family 39 protein [Chloroflexota bacterium]|nr:glycosyltransferase family 39 protein [Chloroflexota bacterium]
MSSTVMRRGRLVLAIMVGLYLVLFGFTTLTYTRSFTSDSMNYVDVARSLLAGRGLVQSTLGFNTPDFSPDAPIPGPFTTQPPLYPFSIALLSVTGVTGADAALLVAVLAYGLVLLLSYLLARILYDEPVAVLVVATLLFYKPLAFVADHAWSETLAVSLALLSLWLLVLVMRGRLSLFAGALLSGLAGGLAFATRYSFAVIALLVVATVGMAALMSRDRKHKTQRLATGTLYVAGFLLVAGPMLLHNWVTTHALLPSYNPATTGLLENTGRALETLFGGYAEVGEVLHREVALAVCLVALLEWVLFRCRAGSGEWLKDAFVRRGRYLLIGWAVAYSALVVYQRSIYHFDELDARLLVPAGVTLVMLIVAFTVRALNLSPRVAVTVAIVAAVAAVGQQSARVWLHASRGTVPERPLPAHLEWLARNTTDEDLIISKDAVDVPFWLGRSGAVSYSPYPYTVHLQHGKVQELAGHKCADYRRLFLVASVTNPDEQRNRLDYGPYITDLASARYESYPGLVLRAQLKGTAIYEVACKPPG